MDRPAAAQALLSLAQQGKGRTKTARLREIFGEIETAQQAGVSNATIVESLNAQGFDLTQKTFETMLYRIRKKSCDQCQGEAHVEAPATPQEPVKRLTIDVPESLHRAIKMQCARRGTKIADEVRELLKASIKTS